jgi:uncharacterized membrane protein YhaH (DUF805 family)
VTDLDPEVPQHVPRGIVGFYLRPRGRISRSQYWLKWALPIVVLTLLFRIAVVAGYRSGGIEVGRPLWIASVVFNFAILWPGAMVMAKRIHDRNKPGWLAAIFYATIILYTIAARLFLNPAQPSIGFAVFALSMVAIFLYFVVEFGFFRGTVGPNRYGPDPVRRASAAAGRSIAPVTVPPQPGRDKTPVRIKGGDVLILGIAAAFILSSLISPIPWYWDIASLVVIAVVLIPILRRRSPTRDGQ